MAEILGLEAFERSMASLADAEPLLKEMAGSLFVRGENTMGISKRLAPVRNRFGGALRASGVVLPPEISGTEASVVMGYGVPYALAAHENPRTGKTGGLAPVASFATPFATSVRQRKYKSWSEVGQWKFLEEPFLAERAGTLYDLAARVHRYFEERLAR